MRKEVGLERPCAVGYSLPTEANLLKFAAEYTAIGFSQRPNRQPAYNFSPFHPARGAGIPRRCGLGRRRVNATTSS